MLNVLLVHIYYRQFESSLWESKHCFVLHTIFSVGKKKLIET